MYSYTLNSVYIEVTFNEKLAIMKENLCTKYFPFTYKYVTLNEKLPIVKENLHIFFFVIGRVECSFMPIGTELSLQDAHLGVSTLLTDFNGTYLKLH